MTNLGKQFHPARDVHKRPTEYENLPDVGGGEGVHITGAGYYEKGELEEATASDRSYGDTSSPLLQPAQGRLFDAESHEREVRKQLGTERLQVHGHDTEALKIREQTLQDTVIPTSHLQPRDVGEKRQETQLISHNQGKGWIGSGMGGWYMGPATDEREDTIAVDPNSAHGARNTLTHEMGHRQHLGTRPAFSEYLNHPKMMQMDPLKEGVADAYVDRYAPNSPEVRNMQEDIDAGAGQKFTSYQFTGYSTDPTYAKERGWTDDDRALYAAVRGHASETGEQATYEPRGRDVREQQGLADYGGGDPTIDATLHGLLSTSPHAAQALRQTGLKDVGARAFRRHRDRQLLSEGQAVQGSLFNEMVGVKSGKVHGYTPAMDSTAEHIPLSQRFDDMDADFARVEEAHGEAALPVHMSHNQFGEKPRTQAEISNSLGVSRVHSSKLGFPER